jgi:hypothetical protein
MGETIDSDDPLDPPLLADELDPPSIPPERLAALREHHLRRFAVELEQLPREDALSVLDRYEQERLAEALRRHALEHVGAGPAPFTPRLSPHMSDNLAKLRLIVKSNCPPASGHAD